MSGRGEFPPEGLRQYALIADGERGALCGPHGELVWMCAPRWHDPAVFSALVGGGGAYAVTPSERCVWGGEYIEGTLIWCNHWATNGSGSVECRDALARPAAKAVITVLRRVTALSGTAAVNVLLDVRAEFGAEEMCSIRQVDRDMWTAESGRLKVRWTGMPGARVDDQGRLVGEMRLAEGDSRDLVLEIALDRFDSDARPDSERLWRSTEDAWKSETPAFENSAAPRDTAHAYAVMRGLTSSDGGMVAAATTSLPERAGNGTNYDYRYAWIRDQAVSGIAVAADGPHPLLHTATQTVGARLLADGVELKPAYTIDGAQIPSVHDLDVLGYPGADAKAGNRVHAQFQLDIFGEALELFAAAARHDILDADGWRAAEIAIAAIETRWDEPDSGIWEIDERWWTHSRLECVAGLRSISACAPANHRMRIDELAEHLMRECVTRCSSEGSAWWRTPDDKAVDAALLMPSLRGAVPADDPRTAATIRAVREQLVSDGYTFRFRPDEGRLGDTEGAFLFCGFMRCLAELHAGDVVEAWRGFERNRASCGPSGLLAEEFDVAQRQLRGNLPQSFVHALMLECSVRLAPYA